jgi:ribosome maturation factor RimP
MIIKVKEHHLQSWALADVKYEKMGRNHVLRIYSWAGHLDDIEFDSIEELTEAQCSIVEAMMKSSLPIRPTMGNCMEV